MLRKNRLLKNLTVITALSLHLPALSAPVHTDYYKDVPYNSQIPPKSQLGKIRLTITLASLVAPQRVFFRPRFYGIYIRADVDIKTGTMTLIDGSVSELGSIEHSTYTNVTPPTARTECKRYFPNAATNACDDISFSHGAGLISFSSLGVDQQAVAEALKNMIISDKRIVLKTVPGDDGILPPGAGHVSFYLSTPDDYDYLENNGAGFNCYYAIYSVGRVG